MKRSQLAQEPIVAIFRKADVRMMKLKRRNAIEPIIGHMKNDGLLGRNYLKGAEGDAINVILCGTGQNLRLILRHLRIFWLNIRAAFDRHWQTHRIGTA